jgi:excinuclease ABC subunit C
MAGARVAATVAANPPVPATVALLPDEPGVYRFRDEHGRALYIGRAVDLRRRVRSYWGSLRDRRHLRKMVPRIAGLEAVVCSSVHEAAWLERNLLEHRKPYWNRTRGGQEVPVFIRLDPGPRLAGLTIVHEGQSLAGALFGPYLGGLKVRLAVSALHRTLSLAYAGDGLTGSDADMARVRGVDPAARESTVSLAMRLLQRDPAAVASVRDELIRRRDAAAAALLFEVAGRIQEELAALDWVVAPQRVTANGGTDADLSGWADGVQVTFKVRAGRLREWSQRACTETAARRAVDATPPAWAEFAHRNAQLAARLSPATADR